jgi:hypothetical protein
MAVSGWSLSHPFTAILSKMPPSSVSKDPGITLSTLPSGRDHLPIYAQLTSTLVPSVTLIPLGHMWPHTHSFGGSGSEHYARHTCRDHIRTTPRVAESCLKRQKLVKILINSDTQNSMADQKQRE